MFLSLLGQGKNYWGTSAGRSQYQPSCPRDHWQPNEADKGHKVNQQTILWRGLLTLYQQYQSDTLEYGFAKT